MTFWRVRFKLSHNCIKGCKCASNVTKPITFSLTCIDKSTMLKDKDANATYGTQLCDRLGTDEVSTKALCDLTQGKRITQYVDD